MMVRQTEDEVLKAKRAEAAKHNPTLKEMLKCFACDDDFLTYMQGMVDSYMMHECKLARNP